MSILTPSYRYPQHNLETRKYFSIDTSTGYYYPLTVGYLFVGHFRNVSGTPRTIQNDGVTNLIVPSLTPDVATLVSDSTDDDALSSPVGSGALYALVSGVNGDQYYRSELVALNGTTPVTTTDTYYLVDNVVVVQVGAAGQQGLITVSIDGNPMGAIRADFGAMLTAHMLVPKNYYFYASRQSMGGSSNVDVNAVLQFNVFGGGTARSLANSFNVDAANTELSFEVPFAIPPGTYVRADAKGSVGDEVTIYFEGLFVHQSVVEPKGHTLSMPVGTILSTEASDIPRRQ